MANLNVNAADVATVQTTLLHESGDLGFDAAQVLAGCGTTQDTADERVNVSAVNPEKLVRRNESMIVEQGDLGQCMSDLHPEAENKSAFRKEGAQHLNATHGSQERACAGRVEHAEIRMRKKVSGGRRLFGCCGSRPVQPDNAAPANVRITASKRIELGTGDQFTDSFGDTQVKLSRKNAHRGIPSRSGTYVSIAAAAQSSTDASTNASATASEDGENLVADTSANVEFAQASEIAAILWKAANAESVGIDQLETLQSLYDSIGANHPQVGKALIAVRDRHHHECVAEQKARRAIVAERALQRAFWDSDIIAMTRVLNANKYLAQETADKATRETLAWLRLKSRIAELQEFEAEQLAALASTQELQTALLSSDIDEMREVLADHRGFDHPLVEAAWRELEKRVESETSRRRRQEAKEEQKQEQEQEQAAEEAKVAGAEVVGEKAAHIAFVVTKDTIEAKPDTIETAIPMAVVMADLGTALKSIDIASMIAASEKYLGLRETQPYIIPLLEKLEKRIALVQEQRNQADLRQKKRAKKKAAIREEMMRRTPVHHEDPCFVMACNAPKAVGMASRDTDKDPTSSGTDVRKTDPDEKFLSRFEVKGVLGQGGFGEVLACWDVKTRRRVAVKVIRAHGDAENTMLKQEELRRLAREAKAAARVKHPYCMQCYGCYLSHDKTKFFLLCEFLAGRSLEDLVLTAGPMAEDAAVRIVMQALEGLQAVHDAGLVHRDIKPDNIILMDLRSADGALHPAKRIVHTGMRLQYCFVFDSIIWKSPDSKDNRFWYGKRTTRRGEILPTVSCSCNTLIRWCVGMMHAGYWQSYGDSGHDD
eukprot:COSAG05_NODE_462_length_9561_cov_5.923378_6_plen_826_part_00